ncbi:uncharacterized protein LOC115211626 isoform X1 [Octopus sinensis]|uniref:Uncharacterized protein LOC115211626 isoform X1 n=2 Tax=Octopus sinensis TaxID=2607531 RepID=A0A6P7SD59_9MOLL|nr:uncharacterized protein LOC115211626 isoform X1 [Octopus sinensis]
MSSDALVKCVAYKLKYHMNVIQREDGFSPSGNCFKYQKPVVYPLPPSLLYLHDGDYSQKKRLSSCSSLENKDSVLSRRKQRYPNIPYYSPALVDKKRKERVVKIASKILVALGCYDGSGLQQANRHKLLPRIQKKNSNLLNIHQRMQHFYEDSSGEEESYSEKEYESTEQRENIDLTQQSDNDAECNRNSDSPVSERGRSCSGADFNHEDEIVTAATPRILTEKHIKLHTEITVSTFKKKTSDGLPPPQINNILPEPYDVLIENSTQTDFTESVDQNIHQQAVNNEITSGSVTNYKIVVKTGNELGASTRAQVKIVLYGDLGRTKSIDLLESKTNKIKFQKGKEDHFFVELFSVGHLEKIRIGHDRPELPYAWFLDQITIYDLQQKWTYEFPCAQWFSGQGGDRKTYRDLLGPYCSTSEDIDNVPVDPLIQLLSETEKNAEKNPNTNNTSDSNYITLYDKLYIRESTDEESTEESSESNESSTSEDYGSEKKVISVQNYVTVETQTVNVNNKPHMTTDIPQSTSYVSKTSKSKSKHKTTMSSGSRQSSIDTSSEDSSSTSAD